MHRPAIQRQKQTMENRSVPSDQKSSPTKPKISEDVSETSDSDHHPPTQIEKEKLKGADSNGLILDNGGKTNPGPSGDHFDSDEEHLDENEEPNIPFHRFKRGHDDKNTSEEEPPTKRCRSVSRICTYRQKNFIHAKGNTICIEIGYVSAEREIFTLEYCSQCEI